MSTSKFQVTGMTCSHCVNAVTEEVSAVDGVTAVEIDLASGALQITSTGDLAAADVREAVEEAGYELAS